MFVSKYETKQWYDMPSEVMDRGSRLHKEIENSILYDLALGKELASIDEFVANLMVMKARGIAVVPEFKFGLDMNMNRCEFFRAPGLRVRCALDVFVNDTGKILTVDWKTGRYYAEHREEARFYGAMTAMAMKAAQATTLYVYIDNPQCTFGEDIDDVAAVVSRNYESFRKADEYLDSPGANGKIRLIDPPMQPGNQCTWCGDLDCPNNKNDKAKAHRASMASQVVKLDGFQ